MIKGQVRGLLDCICMIGIAGECDKGTGSRVARMNLYDRNSGRV